MEVIQVGSSFPSTKYHQLLWHQCGWMSVPYRQKHGLTLEIRIWMKTHCSCLKKDWPKPRKRSFPVHNRLVPEFKLWVKDVQSVATGFIPKRMAWLNSTEDKKFFLIKDSRMVCQIWNISSGLKGFNSQKEIELEHFLYPSISKLCL